MAFEELSTSYANERVSMPYPHVEVLEPSDSIALVLPILQQGDLPVLCEYKGTTRQIGSISLSAITLSRLLKVSSLKFYKDAYTTCTLKDIEDIMEVLTWML